MKTMRLGVACLSGMVWAAGLAAVAQKAAGASAQPPAAPKPQTMTARAAFPPVDPKNFTVASPTPAEVDSFLKAIWGYDENRTWSVAAIQKTSAPGVAKVVVLVEDKSQPGRGTQTVFFTTPDGKHAIAGEVMDFGPKPFAATRNLLREEAKGPARGAKDSQLELVEFADLQCPHCKTAQDTMEQLATDFPQAKIVFENIPIAELHPYALEAAAEGVCVRREKGDDAFFTYARAVFDTQGALTPESHTATLRAAATKAGADPAAAAACAGTQAAKDEVAAEQKLGLQAGVNQTPMLAVNGHLLPVSEIPYEVLKKIVAFQAGQDGVTVHVQPTLSTLK